MKINFSNVSNDDFEALPEGTYLCRVKSAEEKISKSSGNPMGTWTFEIIQEQGKGRIFWLYTPNNDNPFKLAEVLLACGETKETLAAMDEVDFPKYVNCVVNVKVNQEMYEGKMTNKVKKVTAAEGYEGKFGTGSDSGKRRVS